VSEGEREKVSRKGKEEFWRRIILYVSINEWSILIFLTDISWRIWRWIVRAFCLKKWQLPLPFKR
jgi:hypothetical protein